jgi:hypothetical protein
MRVAGLFHARVHVGAICFTVAECNYSPDDAMDDITKNIPAIIDVEASGFGAGSYPIEVGFILPDATAQCYLIRPEPEWVHWEPAAEALHGISRQLLLAQGHDVRDIARLLNDQLQGLDVYSDAWGNDQTWIARLFDAAEQRQLFRVRHLRQLMTDEQVHAWDRVKSQVTTEMGLARHRASMDARILQTTFTRTC